MSTLHPEVTGSRDLKQRTDPLDFIGCASVDVIKLSTKAEPPRNGWIVSKPSHLTTYYYYTLLYTMAL